MLFLALAFLLLALPRLLVIKKIICSSQDGGCDQVLISNLEVVLGKNLREAKKTLNSILSKDFLIKDYSLQYQIPETLRVYILIKKPKFALWNQNEKKGVLVDEKGLILSEIKETNLPKVIISGQLLSPGEMIKESQLFALKIVSDLNYFYQIKEGVLTDEGLEVNLNNGKKLIFPLMGDRRVLLGSLKVLLKDSKIEQVKVIDLRFKNPILK